MRMPDAEAQPAYTAKLVRGGDTAYTSLRRFSLYEEDSFATFFFSEIEQIWMVVVKAGAVAVDDAAVAENGILNSVSKLSLGKSTFLFHNLSRGPGLSQTLVEHFVISNIRTMTYEQIQGIVAKHGAAGDIRKYIEMNRLFISGRDGVQLNYKVYISFLEGRSNPLLSSLLYEMQQSLTQEGMAGVRSEERRVGKECS